MYRMNCRCGNVWHSEEKDLNCQGCKGPARDVGFAYYDSPIGHESTIKPVSSKLIEKLEALKNEFTGSAESETTEKQPFTTDLNVSSKLDIKDELTQSKPANSGSTFSGQLNEPNPDQT